MVPVRKIIHIDMDAFYASVEQRDFPALRGKPVAVGRPGPRMVVSTASYEARRYGVRSALPSLVAQRLCPDLIFQPPRFEVYKAVSMQIRSIFREYTDLVEPLSLDEAYLDVTQDLKNVRSATLIAREIKAKIKTETGLTASAGVSYNKFLAKIASDYRKPDGLCVIEPAAALDFIATLPIEKFYGVGQATARKMHANGIATGADLRTRSEMELVHLFGKAGHYYYGIARGIDTREVTPVRERKSYSVENTYVRDIVTNFERITELYRLEQRLFGLLERDGVSARTLTLKVRYNDFTEQSKSRTFASEPWGFEAWHRCTAELRQAFPWQEKGIRLLGLGVHGLVPPAGTADAHSETTTSRGSDKRVDSTFSSPVELTLF